MHHRVCLGRVPVLIFHSVRRRAPRALGGMTMPAASFDAVLGALRRGGYASITCSQLHAHLTAGAALPPRPILLTFDDGYLDNWTIAAPLLRSHGFRATIFAASDLLADGDALRPRAGENADPPEDGFLNPAELRRLEAEGTAEIQSHGASHARLPISAEIEDYHRPERPCAWLPANAPWGTPVYRSEWLGAARAFTPDPAQAQALIELAAGDASFFARPDWRARLDAVARGRDWRHPGPETEAEQSARLRADLGRSRERLGAVLDRAVDFLAWPGGGSSQAGLAAARAVGFRATFGTSRRCPGVAPDAFAVPRTYFGQEWFGRREPLLHAWKARGVADFESGRLLGLPRIWLANRLMRLLRAPQSPT